LFEVVDEPTPCDGMDAQLTNWMQGGLRTVFNGDRFAMFADGFAHEQPPAVGCLPIYPFFCGNPACEGISSVDAAFFLPVAGIDVIASVNDMSVPGKIFLLSGIQAWRFTALPSRSAAVATLDEGFPKPILAADDSGMGVFAGVSLSPGDLDGPNAAAWVPFSATAPVNTTDRGLLFKGPKVWEFRRPANASAPLTVSPGVPMDSVLKPPVHTLCLGYSAPPGQDLKLAAITYRKWQRWKFPALQAFYKGATTPFETHDGNTWGVLPAKYCSQPGKKPDGCLPYYSRFNKLSSTTDGGPEGCPLSAKGYKTDEVVAGATSGLLVVMCAFVTSFVLACYAALWAGRMKAPAGCSLLQLPAALCTTVTCLFVAQRAHTEHVAVGSNPAYGEGGAAVAAGAVVGTSAASTGDGTAARKAGGCCELDFTFNWDLLLAVLSSTVSFVSFFTWNAWPGWLVFPAVVSAIFLVRAYQGSFGRTLSPGSVKAARSPGVTWWFPPPEWLVPAWVERFLVLGHVYFTGMVAWAIISSPGLPPLGKLSPAQLSRLNGINGRMVAYAVLATSLGSTWAVFVIFSSLVTCSFGFSLKPRIHTRMADAENKKMSAFERTRSVHSGTETLESLTSRAYNGELAGAWRIFAVAMSVLSATYQCVPQGRAILQRLWEQGLYSAQCTKTWSLCEIGNGHCLYFGSGNPGAIALFATTVPLTVALSFSIQLLQHKYDTFFLVTQTHLQWLTDNMPVANAQCTATLEQLRAWWELREFLVEEKLPVLYRFVSPGFAVVLVLDAGLVLALVILDVLEPGGWHSDPAVVVLFVHTVFITAFLLKSCWRLHAGATLQASHATILQRLKRQQLAMTKLEDPATHGAGKASDTQTTAAGLKHALLFAEEIEAMSAVIRLSDHTQKILGVTVTPQKLVLVLGYFASGLVTLLR
jgi:hypothetical protein